MPKFGYQRLVIFLLVAILGRLMCQGGPLMSESKQEEHLDLINKAKKLINN